MIYLITDVNETICKIGYSKGGAASRLPSIQACCPIELKIYMDRDGDRVTEKSIHKSLSHTRIRGEWFTFTRYTVSVFTGCNEYYQKPVLNDVYSDCKMNNLRKVIIDLNPSLLASKSGVARHAIKRLQNGSDIASVKDELSKLAKHMTGEAA